MTLTTRWIPKDSQAIEHPLGVAYVHENETRFYAIAYAGRANKKSFYEQYRTRESRDKRVAEWLKGLEASAASKAKMREERNRPHTLKVGDILHHSWGWEQTNCDYYQVLAVTARRATIQAITAATVGDSSASHGMADRRTAVANEFHGEPITVKVDGYNRVCVSDGVLSHGSCGPWDGKPNYCSWYA